MPPRLTKLIKLRYEIIGRKMKHSFVAQEGICEMHKDLDLVQKQRRTVVDCLHHS